MGSQGNTIENREATGNVYPQTQALVAQLEQDLDKSECASTSTNPSVAELIEVYTAKRRKDNARKAVEAQVNSELIILILDSGSSGCVVLASFLKKAEISIDRPSTIMMIGVYSEQKRSLGEIDRFPVTIGTKTITSKTVVTEAANYAVIEEKETDLEDKSKDDEYEEKNFRRTINKRCERCLKEGHEEEDCVLRKNLNDWTICLMGEIKNEGKTFNLEKIKLLNKYRDIFAHEPAQLRRTTIVQHEIHIEEGPPIKQRYYSISKLKQEFIGKEIGRPKETGLI
ncbi:32840_t:CDS:2, partial [Gigaspora margarita]